MFLSNEPISRRRLLALGSTVVGGAVVLVACGGDDTGASTTTAGSASTSTSGAASTTVAGSGATTPSTAASSSTSSTVASSLSTGTPPTTAFAGADFADLSACRLLPELTQGPYPTLQQIERRDVTEGHDGLPLRVGIQVVDETCQPIEGAVVEIWHCDVDGDYSAYADGYTADDAGEGTTFLRGFQTSNADGIVEFLTVYPGWYTGRAIHIHSKVHIDDTTVLTTQYLFDDDLNAQVMTTEPYAAYGQPDTTNGTDGVTRGDGEADGLLFSVSDDAAIAGKRALIVVGVDPAATSTEGGMPGGGGPGGSPGGPPPSGSGPTPRP